MRLQIIEKLTNEYTVIDIIYVILRFVPLQTGLLVSKDVQYAMGKFSSVQSLNRV